MATPTDDPSPHQAQPSAVSIHDYEVLIAPREAFVDFLLGPHPAVGRTGVAGSAPSTSEA
ncbi:hypothetical protein RCH21_001169 [Arthrobacter sp. PL16]|uniref:hypothetical protein n=1 Tax=Arthrobacter sp. PL16 TaxID=3071720 RepID=UPI002E0B4119|nr:hypothetical protein [Arthrobacter sp. PL16]